MKKRIKTAAAMILCLSVMAGTVQGTTTSAKVKVMKKICCVVEGGTRLLKGSDLICDDYTVTVSGNGCATAKKNKKDSSALLNPYNDYQYNGVIVIGKKEGRSKVILKTKKKKYIYPVIVKSKESVRNHARAALAAAIEAAQNKPESKWAYVDLNGDGVEDLFDNGNLIAYDYEKEKTVTRKTGLDISKVGEVSVSKKKKILYAEAATGSALRVIKADDDEDPYAGEVVGSFFTFDEREIFKINREFGIIRIAIPKEFLPEEEYAKGKNYYCINDPTYDQDDLWYEIYDDKKLEKKIASVIPDAVRVEGVR